MAGSNAHRPRPVGWNGCVCVPAFDPAQGFPSAVQLKFQRCVSAVARVENVDPQPCQVMFSYTVEFRLDLPNGQVLAERTRSGYDAIDLHGFDGILDYWGRSGRELGWEGLDSENILITDPKTIGEFAGSPETLIELPITVTGDQYLAAPESIASQVAVCGGVRVVVTYLP
jgi:hypothetical protein